MAQSPSHQFGQIIGIVLEKAIEPLLADFASRHELFLDKKGPRLARRTQKVTWTDALGNKHDLDFVLEREGSLHEIGTPAAFIETAWRRYTKHSRNKAGEIQGAVLALADTYRSVSPFVGAILAGEFTEGALTQLKSNGFAVLHFSYSEVLQAFETVGIDAAFGERTPDREVAHKIEQWQALSPDDQALAALTLCQSNAVAVQQFMTTLERAINRQIESIRITALHGASHEWIDVETAIAFLVDYDDKSSVHPVLRYEVEISYSSGETIRGQFQDKEATILFLRQYQPRKLTS